MAAAAIGADILEGLKQCGVATVYEAGGAIGALDAAIKPVWPGAKVVGPAFTVRCHPGDNLPLHRALEQAGPGDVIVAQVGGLLGGYWGGVMTVAAQARGIAGLVIDGGVRDSEELQRRGFPVFARGTGVFRTVKHEGGILQEPLLAGGILINPGDIILGDADGVMAIPRAKVEQFLEAARKREAAEVGYVERLQKGETTMEIYGFPPG
jgi:4-hydroxy-4-methyl-2-oxoglutarate aldolase